MGSETDVYDIPFKISGSPNYDNDDNDNDNEEEEREEDCHHRSDKEDELESK